MDPFWRRVEASAPLPLLFGRTAVFLYRGEAASVEIRGDFSDWGPSWDTPAERIGGSDIWRRTVQLLPASRLDYKIVVDGDRWLLDPLNPRQQAGGYGPNSEVRMPDWEPSPWAGRRDGVPRGDLTDDLWLASRRLGYAVRYRVYTPAGVARPAALPSLYVTDGSDYWRDEMGGLVATLDNLHAAGRVRPFVTVFVDPWDERREVNRRESELVPAEDGTWEYCEFLVGELVPAVDATRGTSRSAADRAILGTSLGGVHALFMASAHGDAFGHAMIQSPAVWPGRTQELFGRVLDGEAALPAGRVFLDAGLYERGTLRDSRRLAARLKEGGLELLSVERPDGHSWGHWSHTLPEGLEFLFPPAE